MRHCERGKSQPGCCSRYQEGKPWQEWTRDFELELETTLLYGSWAAVRHRIQQRRSMLITRFRLQTQQFLCRALLTVVRSSPAWLLSLVHARRHRCHTMSQHLFPPARVLLATRSRATHLVNLLSPERSRMVLNVRGHHEQLNP